MDYKEKLEEAKRLYKTANNDQKYVLESLFHELKEENKDERIRKAIGYAIGQSTHSDGTLINGVSGEEAYTWLEKRGKSNPYSGVSFEYNGNIWGMCARDNGVDIILNRELIQHISIEKQGEQKSKNESTDTCDSLIIKSKEFPASEKQDFGYFSETADKVEPKFKVGDWITNGDYTWKIIEVKPLDYILQSQDGNIVDDTISHVDEQFHSFTIEDAKDGDVLASNHSIFIFSQEYMAGKPEAHYGIMNGLFIVKPEGCWTNEKCYPATKEQRDTLKKAMADAGYTFFLERKELEKIENKPAESGQETKPNGGIVWEDFNEGDGYYKINLAYLSKSQVEFIENLVTSWQNPTNNIVGWSEKEQQIIKDAACFILSCVSTAETKEEEKRLEELADKLQDLRPQNTWKPNKEQMNALDSTLQYGAILDDSYEHLNSLYNDLKQLM